MDTNALLAILYEDAHTNRSEAALRRAYQAGRVVTTPIVYAELAADGHFETQAAVDTFLEDFSIQLVEPSRSALFVAGERFQDYVDRRPSGLQCPECGTRQAVTCNDGGTAMGPRQHIAADFLIGGHANTDTDRLLSFDRGFYETYFPSISVVPA